MIGREAMASVDKYFIPLKKLDNDTKRKLIIKLTESLDFEEKSDDVAALFGAWEDSRSADDIISEIRDSRIEKPNTDKLR